MRARGLSQTLGTASALLTAQALQHGHTTAKWLLQPAGSGGAEGPAGGGKGGSTSKVQIPDEAVESCLLGRGSPQECVHRLMQQGGGTAGGGRRPCPSTAAANVVLGGLAVRGHADEAFQVFDWMKQRRKAAEQQVAAAAAAAATRSERARTYGGAPFLAAVPGAPDAWTHQLLLFAALNAPAERRLELTLRAVQEAR